MGKAVTTVTTPEAAAALRRGDLLSGGDGQGRFLVVLPAGPRVDLETMIEIAGRLQRVIGEHIELHFRPGADLFSRWELVRCERRALGMVELHYEPKRDAPA